MKAPDYKRLFESASRRDASVAHFYSMWHQGEYTSFEAMLVDLVLHMWEVNLKLQQDVLNTLNTRVFTIDKKEEEK